MKAIVFTRYGSPDVLELKDVEKPAPGDDEVLVRVHAVSLNDWDWGALHGRSRSPRPGSAGPHDGIRGE